MYQLTGSTHRFAINNAGEMHRKESGYNHTYTHIKNTFLVIFYPSSAFVTHSRKKNTKELMEFKAVANCSYKMLYKTEIFLKNKTLKNSLFHLF